VIIPFALTLPGRNHVFYMRRACTVSSEQVANALLTNKVLLGYLVENDVSNRRCKLAYICELSSKHIGMSIIYA
jgi:hypothetical protein